MFQKSHQVENIDLGLPFSQSFITLYTVRIYKFTFITNRCKDIDYFLSFYYLQLKLVYFDSPFLKSV